MTGAPLDREDLLALGGTRGKRETKVTKSTWGGGREASPSSHEPALAEQPRANPCNVYRLVCQIPLQKVKLESASVY